MYMPYAAEHRHIRYLGCYKDSGNNPDLDYPINDVINYPSQCAQACSNYKYSSVQFDNNVSIQKRFPKRCLNPND